MSNFTKNLRFLRKKKGHTQLSFSELLDIKRSNVGAYEENRAIPKFSVLTKMADYFEITLDEFINDDINEDWKPTSKSSSSNLRVLSVTVDANNNENIELVPVLASAGYLNGYNDPEYVKELPKFSLPMFNQGTYRAFEIKGDSMLPLPSGTFIVTEYVENWQDIKAGQTYIIVSRNDGVVYKRIGNKFKEDKGVKLVSDNKSYDPYWVETADILEVWKAKAFMSTEFPDPVPENSIEGLASMMMEMQKTIKTVTTKDKA